jgi:trk system potassium uptake protein TrkA
MGRRVTHLVRGAMQDYLEIGDNFALVKTTVCQPVVGVPLGEARAREKVAITVNAFKRRAAPWQYAPADTVLHQDDTILVGGQPGAVESFSQLPLG